MSERTSALQQAKQDFVQHATGDHVMTSVYRDLIRLREANGGDHMNEKTFKNFKHDVEDFNKTVRKYLPDCQFTGLDNTGHLYVKKDGSNRQIAIDVRRPVHFPLGESTERQESNPQTRHVPREKTEVTKDEKGFPKEIRYQATADGLEPVTKFTYDETAGFHRVNKITKDDGTKYELITDDKDPNKGKWNVTDAEGHKSVQDLQVQISPNGEWSRLENGKRVTEKLDGTTETAEKTAPPKESKDPKDHKDDKDHRAAEEKEHAARKKLLDLGTQEVGKGPWQAAEKLIPGASIDEIRELTKMLKKYYQEHHNDHTDKLEKLKVGHHWLTEENLKEMMEKCPSLKKRYEALQK